MNIDYQPTHAPGRLGCYTEDITERRRAEAKISHLALHDGLTDLANRNLFEEQSHIVSRGLNATSILRF